MDQAPFLSICIPTFRRVLFLKKLFPSIPDTHMGRIEVCVSDNASNDGTAEYVESQRGRIPRLRYERRDRNYGFDDNLLHVVKMASGKYCWTLGSDDQVVEGAMDIILSVLEKESPAILIACAIACSANGRALWPKIWLPKEIPSLRFKLNERGKLKEYLDLAQGITALGAFISANVFDRDMWNTAPIKPGIADSFVHLNKIGSMIFSNLGSERSFVYLRDPVIRATIENDAVFTTDWSAKKRLFVDLNAITQVADAYIEDPDLKDSYVKALRREHPFLDLIRTAVIPDADEAELKTLNRIFPSCQIFIARHFGYRRNGPIHLALKQLMLHFKAIRFQEMDGEAKDSAGTPRKKTLSKAKAVVKRLPGFIKRVFWLHPLSSVKFGEPYLVKARMELLNLIAGPDFWTRFECGWESMSFDCALKDMLDAMGNHCEASVFILKGCERVLELGGSYGVTAIALSNRNKEVWTFEADVRKSEFAFTLVGVNGKTAGIKPFNCEVVGDEGAVDAAPSSRNAIRGISSILREASFDGLMMNNLDGKEFEIMEAFIRSPELFKFKRGAIRLKTKGMTKEGVETLDAFLAFLRARFGEPEFFQRPSRLKNFERASDALACGKSGYLMLKFAPRCDC